MFQTPLSPPTPLFGPAPSVPSLNDLLPRPEVAEFVRLASTLGASVAESEERDVR